MQKAHKVRRRLHCIVKCIHCGAPNVAIPIAVTIMLDKLANSTTTKKTGTIRAKYPSTLNGELNAQRHIAIDAAMHQITIAESSTISGYGEMGMFK